MARSQSLLELVVLSLFLLEIRDFSIFLKKQIFSLHLENYPQCLKILTNLLFQG